MWLGVQKQSLITPLHTLLVKEKNFLWYEKVCFFGINFHCNFITFLTAKSNLANQEQSFESRDPVWYHDEYGACKISKHLAGYGMKCAWAIFKTKT